MDERKNLIRELEEKRNVDSEERNRLLEGLGETLVKRIGEDNSFKEASENTGGETPGAILEEYRLHQKEIAESSEMINSLESDALKLKELEAAILEKEKKQSRFEKELEEVSVMLGRQLLPDPEYGDIAGSSKQEEENLISKIEELEKKLDDLREPGGGFITWLGKNAKIAVSKNLLVKNRSSLRRLYRGVGGKFLFLEPDKLLDGEASEILEKAHELKEHLSSLAEELTALKGERRKLTDLIGLEGSYARRISGIEKRIAHLIGEFPKIYLRLGTLAVGGSVLTAPETQPDKPHEKSQWVKALSAFMDLDGKDFEVLEKEELLRARIAERELGIKKINASIDIDKKKAEMEKLIKAIDVQKQKITFAEEAIAGYEKQISASEQQVEELETFLRENE